MKSRFALKGSAVCCPDPAVLEPFDLKVVDVDKTLLPKPLRRRASLTTRMAVTAAMAACKRAGVDPGDLPSVFASVGGEIRVTDELCRALPDREESLSPTRFHNSVHNTTAGYWGILNDCRSPAVAIAGLDDTFAIGLLEACSQLNQLGDDILLVCYDETWPQYLAPPMGSIALSSAFVLGSEQANSCWPMISLPMLGTTDQSLNSDIEAIMGSAPAAACIPLMQALDEPHRSSQVALSSGSKHWFTQLEIP